MRPKILVINGHPDPSATRFCAALAGAYATGAQRAGAATMVVDLGSVLADARPMDVELRDAIAAADALAVAYPLWTGDAPPLLKGFLADAAKPVVRTIVTMELPSLFYRDSRAAACDLIGSIGLINPAERSGWLARVAKSGELDGQRLGKQVRRRERWASVRGVFGRPPYMTVPRLEPRFAT